MRRTGIAALRPTLRASSRKIAALNELIEVCRSRSSSREIAALNEFAEALQKQIELLAQALAPALALTQASAQALTQALARNRMRG